MPKRKTPPPPPPPQPKDVMVYVTEERNDLNVRPDDGGRDPRPLAERIEKSLRHICEEAERHVERAATTKADFLAKVGDDPMHALDWADGYVEALARGDEAGRWLHLLKPETREAAKWTPGEALAILSVMATERAVEEAGRFPKTSSHMGRIVALARIEAASWWARVVKERTYGLRCYRTYRRVYPDEPGYAEASR